MKIATGKIKSCDVLIVPISLGSGKDYEPIKAGDFTGKLGEIAVIYDGDQRLMLLGLGEKPDDEAFRKAYIEASAHCIKMKWKRVGSSLPKKGAARAICEGVMLGNYRFDKLKSEKATLIEHFTLEGADREVVKLEELAAGVNLARDLVNDNADTVTPAFLAKTAQKLAREFDSVTTKVLGRTEMEKEKMGLLLAVGRSAAVEPKLIVVRYTGNKRSKETVAILGKGITYDTGGLNLKPTGFMETMKADMGGGAAVLGCIRAAAGLRLKCNLVGIVASSENAIGSKSFKPGDVYTSMNGKTVEIYNTDAEGRLVLADALTYAVRKVKPACMVDLATLTGAVVIALGRERTGLFSNNRALEKALMKAGEKSGDKAWPLPMDDVYADMLKSSVADLRNGKKRYGAAIVGAKFLEEFVEETPWAHLDMGGTGYIDEGCAYKASPATGAGVRLLIEWLASR